MPQHGVFHERHALALRGVRQDAGWLCDCSPVRAERARELLVIVAVDLDDVPAEIAPLRRKRLETERLLGAGQALNLVVVDDGHEAAEALVTRKVDRLPVRAFV